MTENDSMDVRPDALGCPIEAPLLARVECILLYGGNAPLDVGLNYSLLIINVAAGLMFLHPRRSFGIAMLFASLYQITLCLFIGCAGVSIVWCAAAGYMIHHHCSRVPSCGNKKKSVAFVLVLCFDAAAIIYYDFVTEPITTVAHVLAIVMGTGLSWLLGSSSSSSDEESLLLGPSSSEEESSSDHEKSQ